MHRDLPLLVTTVALAACTVVAWYRTAGRQQATRDRLRILGYCIAFDAFAVYAVSLLPMSLIWSNESRALGLAPIAAGVAVTLRPRIGAALLAGTLIVLGSVGFAMARSFDFGIYRGNGYGFAAVDGYTGLGGLTVPFYLIMPQAYAFLLLGAWLGWRELAARPALARRLLGRLAFHPWQDRARALLLLGVAAVASPLVLPSAWFSPELGGIALTAVIGIGALALVRRFPAHSAVAGVIGIIALAAVGLYLAATWPLGRFWPFPLAPGHFIFYGPIVVTSENLTIAAAVEGVLLLGAGAWLTPQVVGQWRRAIASPSTVELASRVRRLTESRADAVQDAALQLRRLERDLHDGAQARLVAVGMSLRAAEQLISTSPAAAAALVAEARKASAMALTELRDLVRGVHPPVLADRGLADAIRALALDSPLSVDTDIALDGRLPAPVETACYFAVAEVLTNAAKHSGSRQASITVGHENGMLRIAVTDFGLGGADPSAGTGLAGVEKRLATFDGVLAVSSPAGGPTIVVMEVPCALSSQKISFS